MRASPAPAVAVALEEIEEAAAAVPVLTVHVAVRPQLLQLVLPPPEAEVVLSYLTIQVVQDAQHVAVVVGYLHNNKWPEYD